MIRCLGSAVYGVSRVFFNRNFSIGRTFLRKALCRHVNPFRTEARQRTEDVRDRPADVARAVKPNMPLRGASRFNQPSCRQCRARVALRVSDSAERAFHGIRRVRFRYFRAARETAGSRHFLFCFIDAASVENLRQKGDGPAAALAQARAERILPERRRFGAALQKAAGAADGLEFQSTSADRAAFAFVPDQHRCADLARR